MIYVSSQLEAINFLTGIDVSPIEKLTASGCDEYEQGEVIIHGVHVYIYIYMSKVK